MVIEIVPSPGRAMLSSGRNSIPLLCGQAWESEGEEPSIQLSGPKPLCEGGPA